MVDWVYQVSAKCRTSARPHLSRALREGPSNGEDSKSSAMHHIYPLLAPSHFSPVLSGTSPPRALFLPSAVSSAVPSALLLAVGRVL